MESIHVFAHQVAVGLCIGGFIVGVFGVEQAKALVVFGGKHRVFHTGGFGLARPFNGIEEVGVKLVEIFLVFLVGHMLVMLYPLVAGGARVQTPMNKHAETRVCPPFHAFLFLSVGFGAEFF